MASVGERPYTVSEQWQLVNDWYEFIESSAADEYPMIAGHKQTYAQIKDPTIERGGDLQKVARTPIQALFYMVEMGFYPPPELLLALSDCWDNYLMNTGKITMEQAFIGNPKKRAGNHAGQEYLRWRLVSVQWEFSQRIRNGMSRQDAAEEVSTLSGGKPDADSILRMMRKVAAKTEK